MPAGIVQFQHIQRHYCPNVERNDRRKASKMNILQTENRHSDFGCFCVQSDDCIFSLLPLNPYQFPRFCSIWLNHFLFFFLCFDFASNSLPGFTCMLFYCNTPDEFRLTRGDSCVSVCSGSDTAIPDSSGQGSIVIIETLNLSEAPTRTLTSKSVQAFSSKKYNADKHPHSSVLPMM